MLGIVSNVKHKDEGDAGLVLKEIIPNGGRTWMPYKYIKM